MGLYPVAGCRFFIGGQLSDKSTDFVAADFAGQSWTEVDGWSQMGDIGDSAQVITTSLINRGRDSKQKGTSNAGSMQNVFAKIDTDPGQIAMIAAVKYKQNYAFKIELNDNAEVSLTGVSMSAASPGVVSKVAHGLVANQALTFAAGSGTLPTGVVEGTQYFVKTVSSADAFTISATPGGSAIVTTGSPSGTYSVTALKAGSQRLFIGLVMGAPETGGDANTIRNMTSTVEINSNIVPVAAAA